MSPRCVYLSPVFFIPPVLPIVQNLQLNRGWMRGHYSRLLLSVPLYILSCAPASALPALVGECPEISAANPGWWPAGI